METLNSKYSYNLSPMQQGMLFDYFLAPESGANIQQMICDLHEELNVPAFKYSWEKVIERHAIFRTSYRWEGLREPQQDVHAAIELPWDERDWRHLPATEQEKELKEYLRDDRIRGFNLEEPAAFRLMLIRTGDNDYKFIWSNHHIMHDGRTRFTIFKEVFAFYEAHLEGRDLDLELPRPYGDYIHWLEQRDLSDSETYFSELLKGFTTTSLPIEHVLAEDANAWKNEKGEQEIKLSVGLTSGLKDLAKKNQLGLSTIVHGAWGIVLSRYSGEEDVIFGEVRACRRSALEGAESMIGLFMNNLPLRVKLPYGRTLVSYLKEIRAQQISLRAHEHTPLAKIYEWVGQPSGKQMFESFVLFDNAFLTTSLQAQGGKWKNREFRLVEKANFPLVLYAWGEPEMVLRIAYDTSRFDDVAIARMCGHLQTVLTSVAENPERTVSDISILTAPEREQLLVEWNATESEYPRNATIHELFEKQAEQTPDAVAIVFEEKELTYSELNRRANQLAHHLKRIGVGPEMLVGICMERSIEMWVGFLGILKAGAAYVALDPSYPKGRLAYMLEDAQVGVLITQANLVDHLPRCSAHVLCLDRDWERISQESDENPVGVVRSGDPAYVIYTSGSTGNPKGVVGLHRGAVNRFNWMWKAYPFEAGEVCCQKTSMSFVDSVWEVFGPLLRGVKTVIITDEKVKDPHLLIRDLAAKQVTRIVAVPSLLRLMLETHDDLQERLPKLKIWVTSGEELSMELAERFQQKMPQGVLINLYGSSEVSADATCYEVGAEKVKKKVPIGRPIANTQVYLLGAHLQPVPIGVPGELYIGGDGLARGYLNREKLTGEKFVANPFKKREVLYRSGDLGRYRRDGNIEYIGRSDHQVKIRGFRIELGEIETILTRHEDVREAVVVARGNEAEDKYLLAYTVAKREPAPTVQDLRSFLQERLPDYMLPSTFIFLNAFPMTPSGKVDRLALPEPEQKRPDLNQPFLPPKRKMEVVLADLWRKMLKIDRVGIHDNFFELGGNSLLAIPIVTWLRQTMEIDLPVVKVFQYPTISGLAGYLNELIKGKSNEPIYEHLTERSRKRKAVFARMTKSKYRR